NLNCIHDESRNAADDEIEFSINEETELSNTQEHQRDRIPTTTVLKTYPTTIQEHIAIASNNFSLTTCVQCQRVFPDFFHGIRVFYRQGPRYWTCSQCASSRASTPTTPASPVVILPPIRKRTVKNK
ncbi:hypothetical protein FO519_009060, partial [Halicephalobus sp. NKZ332]